MTKSQNLEQLSNDEKNLIAACMLQQNFLWPSSYMIEVKLDGDVERTLLYGGDSSKLSVHAGGGSRHYAKHYGDPEWAIVHVEDENVVGWDWNEMAKEALRKFVPSYVAPDDAPREPESGS